MKTLLKFSLKRRFNNKVNTFLSLLFLTIVFALFYADVLSDVFQLQINQPFEIVLDEKSQAWIENKDLWLQQGFVFTQKTGHLLIKMTEDGFVIEGKTDLLIQTKIRDLLLKNHQAKLIAQSSDGVEAFLDRYQNLKVDFDVEALSISQIKQQLIIVLLTSIYFMMLNFIAVNSNEIIAEKTSHILSLILSSVSIQTHFISKFLSGLITILVQISTSILTVVGVAFLRYRYDRGAGLFVLISKYLPIPIEDMNFQSLFSLLDFSWKDGKSFLVSLLFIIMGIALVQILVLVLSSRVKTSEEAGAIQGPFYLILLVLYYGSLSLNSPEQLSSGMAYILSFVPIASMLIMPMRILSGVVLSIDLWISLFISSLTMGVLLVSMYPIYKEGLQKE